MKRACQIELLIFRDYSLQLIGIGLALSVLLVVMMQTPIVAAPILTYMFFMMAAMGSAAYDEQNNWGLYRLALPLSRHDVVLGRYVSIVLLGLAGAICGLAIGFAIMGIASVVELPYGLSGTFAFNGGLVMAMSFAAAFCMLIGSVVAGVITPIYFALGQTKATQILPMIIVLLS